MITKFFIFNIATGEVTATGSMHDSSIAAQAPDGHKAIAGAATIGQVYNESVGTLSPPTATTIIKQVRQERDMRLLLAGHDLSEYSLPDSFPTFTPVQKQAKIDALIAYRQALRDITTQPDPAKILWPTPPV